MHINRTCNSKQTLNVDIGKLRKMFLSAITFLDAHFFERDFTAKDQIKLKFPIHYYSKTKIIGG